MCVTRRVLLGSHLCVCTRACVRVCVLVACVAASACDLCERARV